MAARLAQCTSSKWSAMNRSPVTRSCMYREKRCRAATGAPQARVARSMLARTSGGSPSICAGLSGSSEGALPRAEAGSTPASPSRDTIANMVAGSFQVMFHFSRNHPPAVQPFDLGRGRNNWGVRFATVFAFLDFRIVMLAAGMYLRLSRRPRF